jgi:F-type H+-transporting ATPase subunit epsilon
VAGSLNVEILTPESALWSGPANAVVARSSDGDFTVMAQHTAMVGDLVSGVVRVQTSDGEHAFAVHRGFFQVGPDDDGATLATLLAGIAEAVETIDVARAIAAKERAESVLSQRGDENDESMLDAARSALERAELRISAKS